MVVMHVQLLKKKLTEMFCAMYPLVRWLFQSAVSRGVEMLVNIIFIIGYCGSNLPF